jgi:hypothetical protein
VKDYDVIFVGYPTWWGTLADARFSLFWKPMISRARSVIPFNTSEGSGFGHGVKDIEKACPGATFKEGLALAGMRSNRESESGDQGNG